jgi:hypothetical protein
MPFSNVESLKIYIKKLIVNKKYCREKLVKRGSRCKNVDAYETNAVYRRILVTPLRSNAGDIFDVYLSNLTKTYKLKTTFGRNLLYWML